MRVALFRFAASIHPLSSWTWSTEKLRLPGYIFRDQARPLQSHAGSADPRPLPRLYLWLILSAAIFSREKEGKKAQKEKGKCLRMIGHSTVPQTDLQKR